MKPEFAAHTPPKDFKIWYELKEHLGDVANLVCQFATKFGAGQLAYYSGLWNDLSKYNPETQDYLENCHKASEENLSAPRSGTPLLFMEQN